MKKALLKVIILILPLFISKISFSQQRYFPSFETVFEKFYSKYNYQQNGTVNLYFAKKKDGWHVYESDLLLSFRPNVSDLLFWSASTGKYARLNFPENTDNPDPETISKLLSSNFSGDIYGFARIPYYGYSGWDRDVIKDFGGRADLTDSLLEGLARAYSNYSMSYLWPQYTYMCADQNLPPIPSTEKIPDDRIQNFIKYSDLDIETSLKLARMNPGYQTLVGDAYVKYSDEILYKYSCLSMAGRYDLAKKSLKSGLFNPVVLAMAKNYLNSVPPNGILFSGGDNDTYPLWYIQENENFRTDVTVLNTSLLSLARFLDVIRKRSAYGNRPVKMAWDEKIAMGDNSEYAILDETGSSEIYSIDRLIKTFSQESSVVINDGRGYLRGPGKNYFIKAPENEVLSNKVLDESDRKNIIPEMKFKMDGSIFYRGDIAMLDIIAENHWERPICFSITSNNTFSTPLKKYLQQEGLVYRLVPKDVSDKLNTTIMYNVLIEKFTWPNTGVSTSKKDILTNSFRENFKGLYITLIDGLVAENDLAKAQKVIDRIYLLLPPESCPYNYRDLAAAEALFVMKEKSKALKILEEAVENEANNYNSADIGEKDNLKNEYGYALNIASEMCEKNGLKEKGEKYKAQLEKLQQ